MEKRGYRYTTWQKHWHSSHKNLHLVFFSLLHFITFVSFCRGRCAHKQMAVDAAPLNEPSTFRKSKLTWPQQTAVVRVEPGTTGLKETPAASKSSSAVKWAGGEWNTIEQQSRGRVEYFYCVYPLLHPHSPDSISHLTSHISRNGLTLRFCKFAGEKKMHI